MKKLERIICAAVVVLLLGSLTGTAAHARHSGHGPRVGVGVWLGPGWGPVWGPGWWGPYYPSYYPYYPSERRIVIEHQPEVYVQPAPEAEEQQIYWYYCKDPQGYYPYVRQCPNGWMKVVPSPPTSPSLPPK